MKNSKKCPKCQSTDLIRVEGRVGPYWDGNNIAVGVRRNMAVLVTRYICHECGYTEEWVESREGLDTLKDKYNIVE